MASLPEKKKRSSKSPERRVTRADKIRHLIRKGWTSVDIAKKLEPDNKRKQKVIRGEVRRILAKDEGLVELHELTARGALIESLPDITDGLIRRARTGRAAEVKLAMEASQFHNPRVDHDHSGEVKITLGANMPRPPVQTDELEQGVVDADVVEEE